ncbi:LPS assembly lipoprotein LptE [Amylibacter marinus]|nr:LPS assembly lipoprotein LptE [Amylibacter marinus]
MGCGFEPVYGEKSSASALLGQVDIQVQNSRNSFEFRDRLIERLGRGDASAPYYLTYEFGITSDDLVISDSDNVTRYTLSGVTRYKILERASNTVVFTDKVASNTAYSATSGTYQTSVAERDAHVRLVWDMAEKIATRISIVAPDWPK